MKTIQKNKSKTILVITDNVPDQINGVVTTFKNIEACASRDGYNIVYLDPGQFPYIDCPGYPEVKLSWPRQMGAKIEAINPDHIHIATEGPLGIAAGNYCWRHGLLYNTSYHTKFPEFIKRIYQIPEWMTYWYVKWFHRHSGKVLTTTETMRQELIAHGFKNNIISWTRGVDRETFTPTIPHRPRPTGVTPTVLYVGRVSKEKGLDDLCCLQNYYNIEIVGDGPYRRELERKYKHVKFLGYQKGVELANSYARADVFCFPSRLDTFGIVIIEAMAQGTPVAAYPVPGPIDIIDPGVTGYMAEDLATAIEHALRLRRDQVQAISSKWSWDECWRIFKENLI